MTNTRKSRIADKPFVRKMRPMTLWESGESTGEVSIKDLFEGKGDVEVLTLAGKIDTTKMKKPSFLMVLTAASQYAYPRKDGVYVVPIGCLKD